METLTADLPQVERWRFDQLIFAGYSSDAALTLANDLDIDLHLAMRLIREGCEEETAVRILA